MLKCLLSLIVVFCSAMSFAQKTLQFTDKHFSYELFVDSLLTPDSVNYDCIVKSITITHLKDKKKIQTLIPEENESFCDISNESRFIIEDVNFDGHNDFRLLQFLPAAPNLPYYFWTYSPSLQKFERQTSLEEITSPEFDFKKKLIYSAWRSGCCDHGSRTYQYIKGKPTLIEEFELKTEDGNLISITKKLVNGKLKTVDKTVEEADE